MEFLEQNVIELIALSLSLFAFIVTLVQAKRNSQFRLKMERPELRPGLTIVSNDRALQFELRNIGRGPAYLTSYEFSSEQGEWQPINWTAIFGAMFPNTIDKFEFQKQSLNAPSVIEPFAEVILFKFRIKDDEDWYQHLNHVWRLYAHRIRLRIRYKSDLEEKQYELLTDPSSGVPAPDDEESAAFFEGISEDLSGADQ